MLQFWPYIVEKCEKLCSRIDKEYCNMDRPLNLTKAFGCCTIDTITEFAFAKCHNDLDNPDFHSGLSDVLAQLLGQVHAITHLPWVLKMMNSIPISVQEIVQPGLVVVNKYHGVSNSSRHNVLTCR